MNQAEAALARLRSHGTVRLSVAARGGKTVVREAYQQGCLRARMPRTTTGPAELILMNTAGGLACGDRLDQTLGWEAEARLTVTTQAAERVYRAIGEPATIATSLTIGPRATAEWLPQETILFDGARLRRTLEIDMAGDARLLVLEGIVLGRAAMGETVATGEFDDRWRVRRDGRLIYADALRLDGDIAALMRRPALGAGHGAFATILHVAHDARAALDPVRTVLPAGRGAASAWDGMLAVRLLAGDGAILRADLLRALAVLRQTPMPRVWSC
ncbi:urease accessory protein [Sphingomonas populi]|uniref:Urease accessory protein UreD n=1 Tax=Sphingomonas populi TaxID=2484750 RepID=A0A4Q6XTR5_9SPHN|nr:urease accessory protein UreD [Sphingomonas populi]RZF63265.1 urease accessory protein [Sphingomonas populi]